MTTTNQPRNEKGLTSRERNDLACKIHRQGFIGLGLSLALGLGSLAYIVPDARSNIPQKPQSYQTYVDAKETLETLEDSRNQFTFLRLPYMTEELSEALAGTSGIDREKIEKFDRAISIVQRDIAKIEPEATLYEEKLKNHIDFYQKVYLLPFAITAVGGIGSMVTEGLRRRKLGSYSFTTEEEK